MRNKKKHFILAGILGGVVLLLLMGTLVIPDIASGKSKGKSTWVWTRDVPKPMWWVWGKKYYPAKPVRGGYFHRANGQYVGLMNPNHWPVLDWQLIIYFYEGRMNFDGKYKQRNPWLVKSWKIINPKTVLMKYRKGVKFHDGTTMNAESIKYLFNWIGDKKNGCWSRGLQKIFKSVEVVDEYTLKWRTHDVWGTFPTGWMGFIISAKALKGDVFLREAKKLKKSLKSYKKKLAKYERKGKAAKADKARKKVAGMEEQLSKIMAEVKGHKNTDVYPVGTGPYMFEEASPGNYVKLKRNPDYWFGRTVGHPDMPYFDGIKTTVIPEPTVQLANLRAGKIDAMPVSKSQYRMVKDDPKLNIHVFPNNTTVGLIFNHAKGACKDIRVRKAISHAIDRKALIYGTQFGQARIASSLYPGDHFCHNPKLKPVKYNPELSKKLLAKAGYKNGLTIKGYMGSSISGQTISDAVKGMLAKVGINWKVDSLDAVAIDDRSKNLEYDLAGFVVPYLQDPHSSAFNFYHPDGTFNHGRSKNRKAISLIKKGRSVISEKKRQRIYHQFEKALYDNYEDVWLWWETAIVAYRKRVQGLNKEMYLKGRICYDRSHPMWFKGGSR